MVAIIHVAGVALAFVAGVRHVAAETASLTTAADSTLYSEAARSNGAGAHFFAGRTDSGKVRRGLIAFDVAATVQAGSTITAVTLDLYMSRTEADMVTVNLHRVLSDWGEGASNAPGEEGGGAPASDGDATWIYRIYDTNNPPAAPAWIAAGGDYASVVSAAGAVAGEGFYAWGSTPQMVADVQMWLDDPASDFGWLVAADAVQGQTAKRFDTRENSNSGYRPVLTVSYETASCSADLDGDGFVGITDFLDLLAQWGTDPSGPPDLDGDGVVGITDFLELLANWGICPS
jgi:hypothetical protein